MSSSKTIKIQHRSLPAKPGVYLFRDAQGRVIYIGKATNLRARVSSYWRYTEIQSPTHRRLNLSVFGRAIEEMLHEVRRIDYQVTDSVIEALILEANLIRKYMPKYNVREKDDKSFLYVVVTKEKWPKVMLVRGQELKIENRKWKIFGPYTSANAIRAALDLIRKWFPWRCMTRTDTENYRQTRKKPCFDYYIGRCPGVCIGAISRQDYMKNIRNVILMLEGKKSRVLKNIEREMQKAAKEERFEEAEKLRRTLFALQHIRDVAVITRDALHAQEIPRLRSASLGMTNGGMINIFGRIEGYDISNISGTSAVGSMVVFKNGEPKKSEYRKFRIRTVRGIDDVAMMREVLKRRFAHCEPPLNPPLVKGGKGGVWSLPDLLVIDGGWGQVHAAQEALQAWRMRVPIIGIAKGFKRKQDRPVFDKDNPELARIVENYKDLLLQVRDEAHRFALAYHRKLRKKTISTG